VADVPTVTLNNGVAIPQVGFGVFQVPPEETEHVVRTAIAAGYRLIDTAAMYQNEEAVGRAIASAPRDDLFITTKLSNFDHGYDKTLRAFDASLQLLGIERLDLYLIHWPLPGKDLYVESWRAMEERYRDDRVRAIGVSNFQPAHLRRLLAESDITPAVNQVELHPYFQQRELRAFHAEHQIQTEAWSPLGKGGELLEDKVIVSLAEQHDVDPARIVLRWHLQKGNVVIPKSVTPTRIASNLDLFDFELSTDEMAQIDGLDRGTRLGPDPDQFDPTG
jgi:2,5-diketo-D-gluconate reductase A